MIDYSGFITKSGTLNSKRIKDIPILDGFPDAATSAYVTVNEIQEPKRCLNCNSIIPVDSFRVGWRPNQIACSRQCLDSLSHTIVKEKRNQTMIERYGVENASQHEDFRQKRKATNLAKFGVEYSLSSPIVRDAINATVEQRYGVSSVTQIPEVREKQLKTMLEKYGVTNPMQNEDMLNRALDTKRVKYNWKEKPEDIKPVFGFPYRVLLDEDVMVILNDKDRLVEEYENHGSFDLAEKWGCNYQLIQSYLKKHGYIFKQKQTSFIERKITNFLDDLGIEYELHNRTILDGKEIDIFVPEANLGIEVHGLYYHSYNPLSTVVGISDKNYHRNKFLLAREKGITLFQFFEDQIYQKMAIVESMIRNKVSRIEKRIFARATTVDNVSVKDAKEFCEKNHLSGYSSSSTRLGLFASSGELVSLMTFRKNRFSNHSSPDFEVIRFCTKLNTTVVGGGSKLLSHFLTEIPKDASITTYSDCMTGNGLSYEKMGFVFVEQTAPGYYWVRDGKRNNRMGFQRNKLEKVFGKEFDTSLTEDQIMYSEGFRKLFNAGNFRFVLEQPKLRNV
jgi:G:T-mismatch repair DNA endonuclease (very short patch repair protein)